MEPQTSTTQSTANRNRPATRITYILLGTRQLACAVRNLTLNVQDLAYPIPGAHNLDRQVGVHFHGEPQFGGQSMSKSERAVGCIWLHLDRRFSER